MSISIDNLLKSLASRYYIPAKSPEAVKIDKSVVNIKANLVTHFGGKVDHVKEFGSYKRDTILPAEYDPYSDIDLLIIFKLDYYHYPPSSYLQQLKEFAGKYYGRSNYKKTTPTYTINLEHISYDLVPAYQEISGSILLFQSLALKIPNGDNEWQSTTPDGFNAQLVKVNGDHNHLIKPLVRLLKAWNAKANYPFTGYELEKKIIDFVGYIVFTISLQSLFFRVVDNITASAVWGDNVDRRLVLLRQYTKKVEEAVKAGQQAQAEYWLKHILPF